MPEPAAAGLTLVSFDIDGTMTFGEPPGPVPVSFARAAAFEFWHVDDAPAFLGRGWPDSRDAR